MVDFVAVIKNDTDLYELTWEKQIEKQVMGFLFKEMDIWGRVPSDAHVCLRTEAALEGHSGKRAAVSAKGT